jgi:phytoene synthase
MKEKGDTVQAIRRLLQVADIYYERGLQGLKFLSFRAAVAVAIAACVYSEIGRLVLKRGEESLKTRTVVSPLQKAACVFRGIFLVVKTIPYRLLKPWSRAEIKMLWRLS